MIFEAFLALRFALKLLGASARADFVSWIYETTAPLLAPFRGAFPSPMIEQGFILEFSTLFAILIYAVIGWLLTELVEFIAEAEARRAQNR